MKVAPPSLGWDGEPLIEDDAGGLPRCARSTTSNKLVNDGPKPVCTYLNSQGDGQVETARPGTPGIEVKHTINRFDPRPVRVSENHHVNCGGRGIDLRCLNVMQDIKGQPREVRHHYLRIALGPLDGDVYWLRLQAAPEASLARLDRRSGLHVPECFRWCNKLFRDGNTLGA